MITLHGHGPAFGLPDANPDAMIAAGFLSLAGVAFEAAAPRSTIPADVALTDGDLRVAGLVAIRAYVERHAVVELDAGLCARDRAVAAMVARMLADDLLPAVLHVRDVTDDFAPGIAAEADGADVDGVVLGRGERALAGLAELIGSQRYIMGDRPTAVDAAACAALAHAAAPGEPGLPLPATALRLRIEASVTLSRYLSRTMRRFHPAHPWSEGRPRLQTFPCDLLFSSPAVERAVALMAHL